MAERTTPPGTITLDDLKGMLVREPRPRMTDQEVHEHAVAALNGMRGLTLPNKRRVIRRIAKLLSA